MSSNRGRCRVGPGRCLPLPSLRHAPWSAVPATVGGHGRGRRSGRGHRGRGVTVPIRHWLRLRHRPRPGHGHDPRPGSGTDSDINTGTAPILSSILCTPRRAPAAAAYWSHSGIDELQFVGSRPLCSSCSTNPGSSCGAGRVNTIRCRPRVQPAPVYHDDKPLR